MRLEGSIAAMELLRLILNHEHIPFTVGLGPSGTVFEVKNKKAFQAAMAQWARAFDEIKTRNNV